MGFGAKKVGSGEINHNTIRLFIGEFISAGFDLALSEVHLHLGLSLSSKLISG